jgi:hypothetical protein
MSRKPAKATIDELVRRLRRIIENGGEMTVDWGKGDVYLVFAVQYYTEDPTGKVKFIVSTYDSKYDELRPLFEKYLEKVELAVGNAEEGGVYANDKGATAEYYFRGRINIKVIKRPTIGLTFIIVVAR